MAQGCVPVIVQQHVDEAAALHATRTNLLRAPHVRLHNLLRFDERLAAHLDGLSVAGEHGWTLCQAALEVPSPGVVFTMAARSLEDASNRLEALLAFAEAIPEWRRELLSAIGWTDRRHLTGVVAGFLASMSTYRQTLGISACTLHRVDPGLESGKWISHKSTEVRARAMRGAGELGLLELLSVCVGGSASEDLEFQFWSAWSAVLLGNRGVALDRLTNTAVTQCPRRLSAFNLSLQAMSVDAVHALLQSLALESKERRWLIQGSGIAGDPSYVSWLIGQMASDETARLAGEAFSLITGTDLAWLDLERKPPENFESGPNDDPNDPNVDMDPDEGLPWPDPEKLKAWWAKNSNRFQPGTRYFMGAPVTREHCIDVLKNGYQRQRILAAHSLCLLYPGTQLFNTSAPAWRQQRLLAEMR